VKPKVKITGEFWAQTTEGDGNYKMFRWLESEGAEVLVEPIGTWVEYLIWSARHTAEERLRVDPTRKSLIRKLKIGAVVWRRWYDFYRLGLGFRTDPLPDQRKLAEYAAAYYNTHLKGGEGHLEIGKNVMATKDGHAHMVISLKPFGCMPSTMSDGVQSRVVADFKHSIYIPIETSGDGEVNVKSRVQMKLYEAKMKARGELQAVLDKHGVTIEQVQAYVEKHPKCASAMFKVPEHHGVGTAARFVAQIAGRVR
jgi:predicted nucleotide-binding protein (sugar kinase/HSP70/actin superfamily)